MRFFDRVNGMVEAMIRDGSTIPSEGRALLVDEFGKDHATYFSILSLIAGGRTSRAEIQNVIGSDVGGYLTKLESQYRIVSKKTPFAVKNGNRNMHYAIDDNFLRFWFRFVNKYQSLLELKAYGKLREIVLRDYPVFSGKALEGYFSARLAESGLYTSIGSWWDRRGENEIDIVAVDDIGKKISFFEVKRSGGRGSVALLKRKAEGFFRSCPAYEAHDAHFRVLSMSDMLLDGRQLA